MDEPRSDATAELPGDGSIGIEFAHRNRDEGKLKGTLFNSR
jgi:hypothetical protein